MEGMEEVAVGDGVIEEIVWLDDRSAERLDEKDFSLGSEAEPRTRPRGVTANTINMTSITRRRSTSKFMFQTTATVSCSVSGTGLGRYSD